MISIYYILGISGSGKTTTVDYVCKRDPSINRVIPYTTRPQRPGEIDGKEYHFISDKEYDAIKDTLIADRAYTVYNGETWRYGFKKEAFKEGNNIVIVDLEGYRLIHKRFILDDTDELGILLNTPAVLSKEFLLNRGDNEKEIDRRIKDDIAKLKDWRKYEPGIISIGPFIPYSYYSEFILNLINYENKKRK